MFWLKLNDDGDKIENDQNEWNAIHSEDTADIVHFEMGKGATNVQPELVFLSESPI